MGLAEDSRTELHQKAVREEVGSVVGEVAVVAEEIEVEIVAVIEVGTELDGDTLDHFHVHLLHCRQLEKHGV